MSIVDILSVGASISTMIGLIIAILSLCNYYREKREKLEYEVKKYFFDGKNWRTIKSTKTAKNNSYNFNLIITNENFHSFIGKIKISSTDNTESNLMEDSIAFHYTRIEKNKIDIKIFQVIDLPEDDIKLIEIGTAVLEYFDPELFKIIFNKNVLPDLPRQSYLTTHI